MSASPQWFVRRGQETRGPFGTAQLRELARRHKIRPDDHVRQGGDDEWVVAGSVYGLFADVANQPLVHVVAAPANPNAPSHPSPGVPDRDLMALRRRSSSPYDNMFWMLVFGGPLGLVLLVVLGTGITAYFGVRSLLSDADQEGANAVKRAEIRNAGLGVFGGAGAFAGLVVWLICRFTYHGEAQSTRCPACGKTFAALRCNQSIERGEMIIRSETKWDEVYTPDNPFRPKAYIKRPDQLVVRQQHHVNDSMICKFCGHQWISTETVEV